MTFFKTTFLSKYWIRSSQIAGFCPNNTKIFLEGGGGGQTPSISTNISRPSGILKGPVVQKCLSKILKPTPVFSP